jgi:hypothetical protein
MLDFDLAELYEVETRILNQAVKRNIDLFPKDFMFHLERPELEDMSSQIVMTYTRKRPKSSLPLAFYRTWCVRAFVALKQYTANYKKLAGKLKELKNITKNNSRIFIIQLTTLYRKANRKTYR